MQNKTLGIILHSLKHSDKSSVITIYTEQFGRMSYMVYAINNKKSKFRAAFMQPLSLVELDVYHQPNRDIQQIKDIKISTPFVDIYSNPIKNLIALFVSELLCKTLRHVEAEPELFRFLYNSVIFLDTCNEGLANFFMVFMMKLTSFLGFEPNIENDNNKYFDMLNGVFTNNAPNHKNILQGEILHFFIQVLNTDFENLNTLHLTRENRRKITEALIEYYHLHVVGFQELKSLEVLQEL